MRRGAVVIGTAAASALAAFTYFAQDPSPRSDAIVSNAVVLTTGSTVPKRATTARAEDPQPQVPQTQAPHPQDASAEAVAIVPQPSASAATPPLPHRLVIDRRAERVEIAGHVERTEEREVFAEAARRHFPTDALLVEVAQADAAVIPPDITLAALSALARLAEGRAEIGGNEIALNGRALYAQLPSLVAARLEAAAPEGWTVSVDIAAPERAAANGEAVCQEEIAARLAEGQVAFAVAAATIAEEAEPLLDDLAAILGRCPQAAVEIAGHTDSDGSAAANRRLSQQRAAAVRQALVARGVEAQRLSAVGYGQAQPVAPNDTAENKARNRRIELVVID